MTQIALISYSHPDVEHVSGLRVPTFGRELARRGHRVLLLTCSLEARPAPALGEPELRAMFDAWDGTEPLHVAVAPQPVRWLDVCRSARTPGPLRKAMVAYAFLAHGGPRYDWSEAMAAHWPTLAELFRPEVVFGTFGDTDTLFAARAFARAAECAWIADIKDPWHVFVPFPLRRWVAWRLRDASAITANSVFERELAGHWLGREAEVIYSGAPEDAFSEDAVETLPPTVLLLGGLYSEPNLVRFLEGVVDWLDRRPVGAPRVRFLYAGGASEAVERRATPLRSRCDVDVRGYLPLPELMQLCRGSVANCYLTSKVTFHHKLVELLACRRPILSYPGDQPEVLALAERVGGDVSVCQTPDDVADALDAASRIPPGPIAPSDAGALRQLGWPGQAARLEALLCEVATEWAP